METSFGELKKKEVINVCDGKRLGKVCDVVFTFPGGKVKGTVVPGCKGFRFGKADVFIELKNVTKIGVDVVLVELREQKEPREHEKKKGRWDDDCPPPRPHPDRRDYGEYE